MGCCGCTSCGGGCRGCCGSCGGGCGSCTTYRCYWVGCCSCCGSRGCGSRGCSRGKGCCWKQCPARRAASASVCPDGAGLLVPLSPNSSISPPTTCQSIPGP
ncbi:small cysteine and glycine repeat-containing protein 5-like [Ailuropoda melanoleuca]|uniref:small cysteine and glycine repeat-containing protein 5-like n=1 Tax=Ailuropoda melanoleuca TaxID=9646 RepID=UPI0014949031|nr:small cysteine and glycine repeat-containing protein 5-like [Ailuropoda melanoleuca]